MDIGLKIRRNPNFHYIRYDPLRPTEELTQPYWEKLKLALNAFSPDPFTAPTFDLNFYDPPNSKK